MSDHRRTSAPSAGDAPAQELEALGAWRGGRGVRVRETRSGEELLLLPAAGSTFLPDDAAPAIAPSSASDSSPAAPPQPAWQLLREACRDQPRLCTPATVVTDEITDVCGLPHDAAQIHEGGGAWAVYECGGSTTLLELIEGERETVGQHLRSLVEDLCQALASVHRAGWLLRCLKIDDVLTHDQGCSWRLLVAPATPLARQIWDGTPECARGQWADTAMLAQALFTIATGRSAGAHRDEGSQGLSAPLSLLRDVALAQDPPEWMGAPTPGWAPESLRRALQERFAQEGRLSLGTTGAAQQVARTAGLSAGAPEEERAGPASGPASGADAGIEPRPAQRSGDAARTARSTGDSRLRGRSRSRTLLICACALACLAATAAGAVGLGSLADGAQDPTTERAASIETEPAPTAAAPGTAWFEAPESGPQEAPGPAPAGLESGTASQGSAGQRSAGKGPVEKTTDEAGMRSTEHPRGAAAADDAHAGAGSDAGSVPDAEAVGALRRLVAVRQRALRERDARLLEEIYTPDAQVLAFDRELIERGRREDDPFAGLVLALEDPVPLGNTGPDAESAAVVVRTILTASATPAAEADEQQVDVSLVQLAGQWRIASVSATSRR